MVTLSSAFAKLGPIRVLVIGDLMLDRYTKGKVTRTSPEAPVMILNVVSETTDPGGAGNVAMNLAALGGVVTIVGRVGDDYAGRELRAELLSAGVRVEEIVSESGYGTPVKNRFIASGQQLLRVDHEEVRPLDEVLERELIARMPELIADAEIVAISDYAKGLLTDSLLKSIIACAQAQNTPVVVDPKGKNFSKYSGVTVLKPNLKEAQIAAGLSEKAPLTQVAKEILRLTHAKHLLITLSEGGIAVFDEELQRREFPARVREVVDVTGAGDTVTAIITFALGNGLSIAEAAQLANVAAGIAIEHVGCARVTIPELADRLLHYDVEHKVFHEDHLHALQQALIGRKFVILGIDSRDGITGETFTAIRSLTQDGECEVIVYIRDEDPNDAFIHLLESIRDIRFIILKKASLLSFANNLQPHEVYQYHEGALQKVTHSAALIGASS